MPKPSAGYVYDSANECDRLERQAALLGPERVLRAVQPPSGARILDAGCGSGAAARIIARHYPEVNVVGLDFSHDYVAYAGRRAEEEGLRNLTFQQGDVQALPFPDASLDIIWSQFVLYFLARPGAGVAEFRRVLRPGGRVVVALHESLLHHPDNPSLQARLDRVMPGLLDIRLARRLPMMLRAAGFADVVVEIELDPVYTAIGRIGDGSRRNFAEITGSALPRIAEILGGQNEAEVFRADLLAWLDRPDTCSYSLLWTVSGVASE
jgi:SAM-dependent methyltransferase